eukprot:GHVP01055109.1.p1 GENE.GHVP01055109.1~~GHVP01055109.1.p1  ORF type:complete len:407 (+),score=63.27 GHVP01055109.1:168-1388(+)
MKLADNCIKDNYLDATYIKLLFPPPLEDAILDEMDEFEIGIRGGIVLRGWTRPHSVASMILSLARKMLRNDRNNPVVKKLELFEDIKNPIDIENIENPSWKNSKDIPIYLDTKNQLLKTISTSEELRNVPVLPFLTSQELNTEWDELSEIDYKASLITFHEYAHILHHKSPNRDVYDLKQIFDKVQWNRSSNMVFMVSEDIGFNDIPTIPPPMENNFTLDQWKSNSRKKELQTIETNHEIGINKLKNNLNKDYLPHQGYIGYHNFQYVIVDDLNYIGPGLVRYPVVNSQALRLYGRSAIGTEVFKTRKRCESQCHEELVFPELVQFQRRNNTVDVVKRNPMCTGKDKETPARREPARPVTSVRRGSTAVLNTGRSPAQETIAGHRRLLHHQRGNIPVQLNLKEPLQ